MSSASGLGRPKVPARSPRALLLPFSCWLLASPAAGSWPDPACDLPDYEEVTGAPEWLALPDHRMPLHLSGVEDGIVVTRISGRPGGFVGDAAPGKYWPEVMTHSYSLVRPCNADDTLCMLDVDRDCTDVGPPGLPHFDCSDTPLGPLLFDSETLRPVRELSDPMGEDRRWHPSDPSLLVYVNESGEVGYLDVRTDVKTPVRHFAGYAGLKLGAGGNKSNPSLAGDALALFGIRAQDGRSVCFAYNLVTDSKGPDIVTESDTWCGMSHKGEILTVYFRGASTRPGQLDSYDLQGNLLTSFPENQHPSHWAFTIVDPFGSAIEAAVGRQKVAGQDPQILRSLSTGAIAQLDVGFGWSHTSTTNEPKYRGWSITSQSGGDGRIGLVSHQATPDGDGVTKFVAYTRSDRRDDEGELDNRSEPTCADFGRRRIICSSNWHSQVARGEGVASFVWDLGAHGGPCRNLPPDVWPRPLPACDDGVDNDGDGFVDLADPACADPSASSEVQQCQDGLDNDGDGLVDFDGGVSIHGAASSAVTAADPECDGFGWRPNERRRRRCGLGFGVGGALALLLSCRRRLNPAQKAADEQNGDV